MFWDLVAFLCLVLVFCLVDFGCGIGELIVVLVAYFGVVEILGIDYVEGMLVEVCSWVGGLVWFEYGDLARFY